jgi:hypothetical protein
MALAWAEDEGELRESDVALLGEVANVRAQLDQLLLTTTTDWERRTVEWLEEPFAVLLARAEMCDGAWS